MAELKDRSDPFYVSAISAGEIALLIKRRRLDIGKSAKDWFATAELFSAWRTSPLDAETAL